MLALNKPCGLAVQGGTKTVKHVDRLLSAWGEGMDRPRLVHRLDRDTSGVLLLGKTPAAAGYVAGSVILSILAVMAGLLIMRKALA